VPTSFELPTYHPVNCPTWVGDFTITVGVVAASTLGGWVTTESVVTWYPTLSKPEWTPPAWLFGPVWAVLYVTIAAAGILVWRRRADRAVGTPLAVFAAQLAANGLWSVLFFGLRSPLLALIDIAALWALIAWTVVAFGRTRPLAAWLLVPYWLWVSFAAALNASIWLRN
jgi:translocator protein